MAGFKKKASREIPEMNTSSLPDLIFTILFFFMMVTTMREVTLKVKFTTPAGTELEKLEKKSVVSFMVPQQTICVRRWVAVHVFNSTTALQRHAKSLTSWLQNVKA